MINNIKRIITSALLLAVVASPLAVPATVSASLPSPVPAPSGGLQQNLCSGTELSADGTCQSVDANTSVNNAVKLGLNLFSAVVGIIAVVMIIVGGIKYITSGGDAGNVTAAKNTILYAVIGLVVVALAQIIVRFVLERFTSGVA